MRKNFPKYLFILFLFSSFLFGSSNRETRAVWVTTNFALDWPPNSLDEETQKRSLRNIFIDLNNKHFNTVYFQVRSNGTVMYNSKIEPLSPYLTGEVGVSPNYDPLQYAIELGKEFNLEVHAWVNMIRCFSGSNDNVLKHPQHIRNTHPNWTVRVMSESGKLSYWMNPGYYRAQDYLVDLLVEITSNYDVDGIHLDFFRYPDKNFEDEKYFKNYGLNISLEDWRRNNLTTILRKFKERANPKNKYLKVGATPIGIRKSLKGAIGWEGYSSVFQDTEQWLKEKLVDYLTPQIYWDLNKNPKFEILAKDWVNKSYNRNIILGLAAYKDDVKIELPEMIKLSREVGAAGVSFFRYKNISSKNTKYFSSFVRPTNMSWKQENKGTPEKIEATYNTISNDEILIKWNNSNYGRESDFRKFALVSNQKLTRLIDLTKNKVKLKFGKPSKLLYNYQIVKIDRLWNYASLSNNIDIYVPYLAELKKSTYLYPKPMLYNDNNGTAILAITSMEDQIALIDFFSIENLRRQQRANLKTGLNLISIKEDLKSIKTLRITYTNSKREEELNFY